MKYNHAARTGRVNSGARGETIVMVVEGSAVNRRAGERSARRSARAVYVARLDQSSAFPLQFRNFVCAAYAHEEKHDRPLDNAIMLNYDVCMVICKASGCAREAGYVVTFNRGSWRGINRYAPKHVSYVAPERAMFCLTCAEYEASRKNAERAAKGKGRVK